jgi:hypothetical protein
MRTRRNDMAELLSDDEIAAGPEGLPWSRDDDEIVDILDPVAGRNPPDLLLPFALSPR